MNFFDDIQVQLQDIKINKYIHIHVDIDLVDVTMDVIMRIFSFFDSCFEIDKMTADKDVSLSLKLKNPRRDQLCINSSCEH